MLVQNPHPSKEYFVSGFISGLGDEVRPMVKMMQPTTVRQAAESVRLQEMTTEALLKKQCSQVKGMISGGWQSGNRNLGREMGHSGKGVLA